MTSAAWEQTARELGAAIGADAIRLAAPIGRYTTWRVGGRAAVLCEVRSAAALRDAVAVARDAGIPWIVLGRGSNVLVDDRGILGVVIVNRAVGLNIDRSEARAESGVLLSVLARRTVAAGLVGLEWCHDIPGSVGGAVVSNAGANGGCIADVLREVSIITADGEARRVAAGDLGFGYRRSALRSEDGEMACERPVVLEAQFELRPGAMAETTERMGAQRARRKATQPGGASAGSVFKNPPGDSAGRLVESVGLKGVAHGDAAISTLHANFIVTGPRAKAADVLALVSLMRRRVWDERAVRLEPEIQFIAQDTRIGPPRWEAS